ncbi:hypothetical protein Taro_019114 [Colocasia esculenta]|uniref:Uncharacterized protein n=1 Tax=Colocasia esculenta TaxID=4460 RepID=A0A843UY93_COLES|nr:hypothetical protein [Colocasia esculenta]
MVGGGRRRGPNGEERRCSEGGSVWRNAACFVLLVLCCFSARAAALRPIRERVASSSGLSSWSDEQPFLRRDDSDFGPYASWNITGTYTAHDLDILESGYALLGAVTFRDVFDNGHDFGVNKMRVEGVYVCPFRQLRMVASSPLRAVSFAGTFLQHSSLHGLGGRLPLECPSCLGAHDQWGGVAIRVLTCFGCGGTAGAHQALLPWLSFRHCEVESINIKRHLEEVAGGSWEVSKILTSSVLAVGSDREVVGRLADIGLLVAGSSILRLQWLEQVSLSFSLVGLRTKVLAIIQASGPAVILTVAMVFNGGGALGAGTVSPRTTLDESEGWVASWFVKQDPCPVGKLETYLTD